MESRKMVQMNLFAGRNKVTNLENRHVDTQQRGKGRGVQTGRAALIHIHCHKTDSWWELSSVLCGHPEGGPEGWGREVQ